MNIGRDIRIGPLESADSIDALTELLHRAYAGLGSMGLNYTAVDQASTTTAERISYGRCFVAVAHSALVGSIVVDAPFPGSPCAYLARPEVAAAQ